MSDPSPVPFWELHPILKQALIDARQLTWQQIGVPAGTALSFWVIQIWSDYNAHRLELGASAKTLLYSLGLGIGLYALVALVRAPFVVIGQQHRQLASLQQRLSAIQSVNYQPLERPHEEGNSFSGFRVLSENDLRLEFEFWYFYNGALGEDNIAIYASLEEDGRPVFTIRQIRAYMDLDIVGHKALGKMMLLYQPHEGEKVNLRSTHVVLTLEHDKKEAVFYRQPIPYEKIWNALGSK